MSAVRPLRIGLVGTGAILAAHLNGYRLARAAGADVEITAVVTRDVRRAAHALGLDDGQGPAPVATRDADPLSLPRVRIGDVQSRRPEMYGDLGTMLAADGVDALDILLPVHLHHTVAIAGLEAGLHVMVQKPVAITMAAGRAIERAARRSNGSVVSVMENLRFHRASRLASRYVAEGWIGRPQVVGWCYAGTSEWAPDRVVADTPWRHRRLEAGAGSVLDMGVHMAHRLRFVVGEVVSVSGLTAIGARIRRTSSGEEVPSDVDDTFAASVAFENGALGSIAFSWAARGGRVADTALHVLGSAGGIHDDLTVDTNGESVPLDAVPGFANGADLQRWLEPHGVQDMFAAQYLDWLAAIEGGGRPEVDLESGLTDLAVALAILESDHSRREVAVADVRHSVVRAAQRTVDVTLGLTS